MEKIGIKIYLQIPVTVFSPLINIYRMFRSRVRSRPPEVMLRNIEYSVANLK
jgi:hypothetical protein